MTVAPWAVGPHTPLSIAHEIMREHDIRHLPVLDGGRLVGIVSRGDLHLLETVAEFSLDAVDVEEAMSDHPLVVARDTPVDEVADVMATRKYGCVVVGPPDGPLEGIFTTNDALRALAELTHSDLPAEDDSVAFVPDSPDEPTPWDDVRRLADEVQLEIHLASMEVRQRWESLQPRWNKLERELAHAGQRASEAIRDELASLRHALERLRGDMRDSKAT